MSKWLLLRSAISGKRDSDSSSSIHRFNGFQLVKRRKIVWKGFEFFYDQCQEAQSLRDSVLLRISAIDTCSCVVVLPDNDENRKLIEEGYHRGYWTNEGVEGLKLRINHATFQPNMKVCCFYEYSIPVSNNEEELKLYTREKPKDSGLSSSALLSNKIHNVDNTGNICIWPAESILLHTLLNNQKYTDWIRSSSRIIELGGGLTALAGLGVAAWFSGLDDAKTREVVLTDGHPDCVTNQRVCIEMCHQKDSISRSFSVTAQLLHWSIDSNSETISLLTKNNTSLFDVIIASDCLFFRDFHDDLIQTILRLLTPDGRVVMLQPQRDGTLNQFVTKCAPYFNVLYDDYNDQVLKLRDEYIAQSATNGYNDDIHYPMMLILTRK